MRIKTLIGWSVIFMIGLLPVILLFAIGPKDYSSISHTLGQISGLVGMTFFALTFLLSTRAKWIEDIFGGLDKVYPVHSVLGATSFVLLLMHPLFLVMKFIPQNFKLAAVYLLPGGLLSVDFGIFALIGMTLLLSITLYSKLRYDRWKFSHEFMGLFFILAVLHIFLVRNTVARDNIFDGYYVYVVVVGLIGIVSFGYSLARTKIKGRQYKIKKVISYKDWFEIVLEPIGKPVKFNSGQFVFVKFYSKSVSRESHPFSIVSPSGKGIVRVMAKNLGDYTSTLGKLSTGDSAIVEGPYGRFHTKGFAGEIWVAGGIGITPFLGLAEDFRIKKTGYIDLYYTVKNHDEFIELDKLQSIAAENKNFKVYPWVSSTDGHLTVREIEKRSLLTNKEFYLCGPDNLKASIKKDLSDKQISSQRIHDERFAFR